MRADQAAVPKIFSIEIFARLAFRQKQPKGAQSRVSLPLRSSERRPQPEAGRYNPSGCGTHRGSYAGAGADGPACEIEPTGPCGEICYYQYGHYRDNGADDPVSCLGFHNKKWALADTQKRTPDWLQSEADQQDRLATPLLSIMTDPRPCDSDDKLRHNYGGCHKNRADALLPAAKILADQRKH